MARSVYVAALLVLLSTAWLILTGTQIVRNVGDLARFGATLFQLLSPLQLALAIFFSALMAGSAVAQEKDRRTLVLLLLTNLTNCELVLGKLLAGMLNVLVLLAASLPVFMLTALFGGVSFGQIGRVFLVTLASALAAGSLGSTLALWREKTFQTLALTLLVLVFWLLAGEAIARGALGDAWQGVSARTWAAGLSPVQAILVATQPSIQFERELPWVGNPINLFLMVSFALSVILNGVAISLVRVWNPSREARPQQQDDAEENLPAEAVLAARSVHAAPGKTRHAWDNPVLWREICTWAYGRRVLVIRLAYLLLAGLTTMAVVNLVQSGVGITRANGALLLVPLFLLSLILVNAQAVTALTSERDTGALDLLLVTDLTPKEFVFGKLGGVLYNTKEMVLIPLLLCGYLWLAGAVSGENTLYLIGGLAVMYAFVAMLGVHAGMAYDNSRSAIGASLGTLFFLFIGIATCMRMMLAFSGAFQVQLQPFLAFMVGGGLGLYVVLGARNPSPAIAVASFLCPTVTFWAITSLLLGNTLSVFLAAAGTYGFTTAAMLIPAIFEFDVATGRTTGGEE